MSLRNRARALRKATGVTYQQALNKLRALGERPARPHRESGWPLEVCDRFLVDGHAPIAVVELTPIGSLQEELTAICEDLRARANARAVVLGRDGRLLAHSGDGSGRETKWLALVIGLQTDAGPRRSAADLTS